MPRRRIATISGGLPQDAAGCRRSRLRRRRVARLAPLEDEERQPSQHLLPREWILSADGRVDARDGAHFAGNHVRNLRSRDASNGAARDQQSCRKRQTPPALRTWR